LINDVPQRDAEKKERQDEKIRAFNDRENAEKQKQLEKDEFDTKWGPRMTTWANDSGASATNNHTRYPPSTHSFCRKQAQTDSKPSFLNAFSAVERSEVEGDGFGGTIAAQAGQNGVQKGDACRPPRQGRLREQRTDFYRGKDLRGAAGCMDGVRAERNEVGSKRLGRGAGSGYTLQFPVYAGGDPARFSNTARKFREIRFSATRRALRILHEQHNIYASGRSIP
jgi:hypothetical protein